MPLIGYKLGSGSVVCADCNLFPPNSTCIHVGDPEETCDCVVCRRELTQVAPVGGWEDDPNG